MAGSWPGALVSSLSPGYSVPLLPMLNRGRPVAGWLPGYHRPGPPRRAPRWSWEEMECVPSPRDQPEARTNAHCSVTAPVRTPDVRDPSPRRQRGGTPVGVCLGGCGEGVRGEPRRQSFVKLSRSINDKNSSFAQIGYLSFQRHIDYGYPRAWTS